MPAIHDTAYPRLKSLPTSRELAALYTPTSAEVVLATQTAKGAVARVGFLVLLKTFQRLGYAVPIAAVPPAIIAHIAGALPGGITPALLVTYDGSGTRRRHLPAIRAYLQVRGCDAAGRRLLVRAMADVAPVKDDLVDLINVAIEALVRQRYELPAFGALNRAARRVRGTVQRVVYQRVYGDLGAATRAQLDALFSPELGAHRTPWHELKADADRPTLTHLKELIARQDWLARHNLGSTALAGIPAVTVERFAAEAKTLDAARMLAMEPHKRATLAAALLAVQSARALDALGTMFVRQMQRIHAAARQALEEYRTATVERTDALVGTLRDLVVAHRQAGTVDERFAAMDAVLRPHSDQLLEDCDTHMAHAGHTYYPFLWRHYQSHRATLFSLLAALTLRSTTQDTALEVSLRFLRDHAGRTSEWLPTARVERGDDGQTRRIPLLDLSWIPDGWWRLVTGEQRRSSLPDRVNRRHFEVCVFSEMLWELKSGDLAIVGSDEFADYNDQLVSWDEYRESIAAYGEVADLPVDAAPFVAQARARLEAIAQETDRAFPANKFVRIEHGAPVITRPLRPPDAPSVLALETLLAERLQMVNILDLLSDTEHWLRWTRFFGPISGHDTKLEDPVGRYLTTVFCYGTNIGPSEGARSLDGLDRRQIAWVNQRHITEEGLDQANACVITAYSRLLLPKCWGVGTRVSADGTKWELYENNLLSERHVRYGSYGGIGYYHVTDTYIAWFAHFIPCGAFEGHYILDPFFQNKSEIHPDTVHADSHGQSETIFGLAALLGIELMPRIRQWKDLTLYRPSKESRYEHIDEVFSATVDWELIAAHLPDMLRVALSIKAGRLTPSTILRKLGMYSRKNRLFHAFRELGRAMRSGFLLQYMGDADLRSMIQAATSKNESFNDFAQWVLFGGASVIAENDRAEQRKIVKYNQLVANCLIFANVWMMTRVFQGLREEGIPVGTEDVAALSPYVREHIIRFGRYALDRERMPPPIDYAAPVTSAAQ